MERVIWSMDSCQSPTSTIRQRLSLPRVANHPRRLWIGRWRNACMHKRMLPVAVQASDWPTSQNFDPRVSCSIRMVFFKEERGFPNKFVQQYSWTVGANPRWDFWKCLPFLSQLLVLCHHDLLSSSAFQLFESLNAFFDLFEHQSRSELIRYPTSTPLI